MIHYLVTILVIMSVSVILNAIHISLFFAISPSKVAPSAIPCSSYFFCLTGLNFFYGYICLSPAGAGVFPLFLSLSHWPLFLTSLSLTISPSGWGDIVRHSSFIRPSSYFLCFSLCLTGLNFIHGSVFVYIL